MRHAHLLAGLCAALITIAQPALADHHRPAVRFEIAGLKVFESAVGGVTYVAGGRHYCRRHHHHHRGHQDRGVSGTIIITVPVY